MQNPNQTKQKTQPKKSDHWYQILVLMSPFWTLFKKMILNFEILN